MSFDCLASVVECFLYRVASAKAAPEDQARRRQRRSSVPSGQMMTAGNHAVTPFTEVFPHLFGWIAWEYEAAI
jgi:hypothetical protein